MAGQGNGPKTGICRGCATRMSVRRLYWFTLGRAMSYARTMVCAPCLRAEGYRATVLKRVG